MANKTKGASYYQLLFLLLAAASVLLIFLFMREYTRSDTFPVGRVPLLAVVIGFTLYYGTRWAGMRRK